MCATMLWPSDDKWRQSLDILQLDKQELEESNLSVPGFQPAYQGSEE